MKNNLKQKQKYQRIGNTLSAAAVKKLHKFLRHF